MRSTAVILHAVLAALCAGKSRRLPQPARSSTASRVDMNFTELVQFDGYDSEWHQVITDDGYVLSLFRVRTRGPCSKTRRKKAIAAGGDIYEGNNRKHSDEEVPILFAHGLYLSGDDCVTPGPNNAHCYLYADSCHDVWVFNARGSRYSRKHKTLNPDKDREYWNFAFDEMALHDLPATIDFILDQTKQKQVAYVGHSQGVAILMLLCAKKPEYNDKIKVGFGLSTIASLSHARFVIVQIQKILSSFLPVIDKAGAQSEIFRYGAISQQLARFICSQTPLSYTICSGLIFAMIGYNRFDITPEVLPVFFGHLPSGTSTKNFLRWGQVAKIGFTEYDYGEDGNLEKYGDRTPPPIDLSGVSMRWVLICSTNDYISDLKDVDDIVAQLPNVQKCVLSDNNVGHLDFVFGKSVTKYVVPMILSVLDENKYVCL